MKFELEPYHRNVSDEKLLEDLRKIARHHQRKSVTIEEYDRYGAYHSSSLRKRFGSWFTALKRAGLEKTRSELNIPVENLIADLKRVSQELGKDNVTFKEYSKHGQYAASTLIGHFGSWRLTLEQNGLKPSTPHRVPRENYFENLEYVWRTLGRQPRYSDMQKPLSKYSAKTYEQKFGTWRKALESFIAFVNIDARWTSEPIIHNQPPPLIASGSSTTKKVAQTKRKTSRIVSWRLRFLIMRRDNFRCCLCGAMQNVDKNISLEVDHIIPWSTGGETIMGNLQTLCNRCNSGKSNLSMQKEERPNRVRDGS